MLAWGCASFMNAWVTGPHSLLWHSFLLGLGEAGLYPGLSISWDCGAPGRYRVRMPDADDPVDAFSIVVGSLISQPILMWDGALGLAGLAMAFHTPGPATLALGLAFRFALPKGPQRAMAAA